jgi:3-oxoacyl-ACP reductase-like protein
MSVTRQCIECAREFTWERPGRPPTLTRCPKCLTEHEQRATEKPRRKAKRAMPAPPYVPAPASAPRPNDKPIVAFGPVVDMLVAEIAQLEDEIVKRRTAIDALQALGAI